MEADSLNCCVLGEDVTPQMPEFALFIKEVSREMTSKAGQKCTAIRRIIVPAARIAEVQQALLQRLANEELAQAEYEDQVRAKVTAARADTRPGMTTEQLRQRLHGRYQELRDAV